LREDDPSVGIKLPRRRTQGFYSWTEDDIERYRAHHPIGSRPRLALELALNTGLRRSDLVRVGRQNVRNGTLYVVPKKTERTVGQTLAIPIAPDLAVAIDATPPDNLTFLVTQAGAPFTAAGFGNHFRDWCDAAGLSHCSAHGLRKAI
jgi:integrase